MPSIIRIICPKTNTIWGEIFYPGLKVDVWLTLVGYQPIEFILDSGADCTLVPRYMANLVGIPIPSMPDTYVTGITRRRMPAYKGRLRLRIQSEEFEVRCLFTRSNTTAFLLGRLDFFSLFDVRFDGRNGQIILSRR